MALCHCHYPAILYSFRTVINILFSINFLECFVELVVYSLAVSDFYVSCVFLALVEDQGYSLDSPS